MNNKTMKPRKPIKRVSSARARQLRQYSRDRKLFLEQQLWCAACAIVPLRIGQPGAWLINRATEVHHRFGRQGQLLNYQPYWLPVCRQCHDWIGRNPAAARKLGLLAPVGQWNTMPKDI